MKRLIIVFLGLCLLAQANAQPKKSRTASVATTTMQANDRASLQFPTASTMPEDVVWRRDVYRQLDLTQDKNAPLYYPVEPHGNQVNLFTFLFRMMLDNKVKVYEYSLDGNESFAEKDVIKPRDFLEKYSIYYEENGNRLMVSNSDIPSAYVTRMYLKESIYFDQRTSSFHKQVTALCPVLVRKDDFEGTSTPYPLFWVKYSDAAPFLSKLPMMGSNYNNVTNMTADDYFTLNRYDGKIYKTNNLQGRVLANYCKTDSALVKEQNRIEQELKDLELSVWGKRDVLPDSLNASEDQKNGEAGKQTDKASDRRSARKTKSEKVKSTSTKSAAVQAAPRVSVRRQRR